MFFILTIIAELYDLLFINYFYSNKLTKTQKIIFILFLCCVSFIDAFTFYEVSFDNRPYIGSGLSEEEKKYYENLDRELNYIQKCHDNAKENPSTLLTENQKKLYLIAELTFVVGGIIYILFFKK